MKNNKLLFIKPEEKESLEQLLIGQGISAGFPSPADDFQEVRISLDRELVGWSWFGELIAQAKVYRRWFGLA